MVTPQVRILGEEDVEASVKETAQIDFAQRVVFQLEQALETVKGTLFEHALMPGVPTVTVRVETLHRILGGLRVAVPKQSSEILKAIGRGVGQDFARSVEAFLADHGFVAANEAVILRVWSMLDGGAGWGQFRPSLLPDRVDVSLEGSSLLAGDDSSVSATLDFLCGYTWGVTWDLLKYQPRRLREAGVGARGPVLEPESVSGELVGPGGATFALRLKEEELAGSYDIIYKAWRLIRRGDLRKIGVEIRSALENGLKGKVNATSSEPLMVPYLSKAYKEQGVGDRVKFRFDALDRVYFALNPDAHGDPDIPLEDAVHHLRTVEEAIDELELETVGEGRKKAILEGARKRRDKQAPVSVTQVVQAGRDATVQANVGSEGAVQVVGEDPVRVAAIRETLAEIREMLEDDDEQQREAGQEIDAILEGDGASWEDLASRTSAVVKMLAGVGLLTDLLTRLVELLQRTT